MKKKKLTRRGKTEDQLVIEINIGTGGRRLFRRNGVDVYKKHRQIDNLLKQAYRAAPAEGNPRSSVYVVQNYGTVDKEMSLMADLLGTDKGGEKADHNPFSWQRHSYTKFYSDVFGLIRDQSIRILECGIGTNNVAVASNMTLNGVPGASLRLWKKYFPNAEVFGFDIDTGINFQADGITTFFADQRDPVALNLFFNSKNNDRKTFDIIIDDGLHTFDAGSRFFTIAFDWLSKNGVYIIEDVIVEDIKKYKEFFFRNGLAFEVVAFYREGQTLRDDRLIVVRKQKAMNKN